MNNTYIWYKWVHDVIKIPVVSIFVINLIYIYTFGESYKQVDLLVLQNIFSRLLVHFKLHD